MDKQLLERSYTEIVGTNFGECQCHVETMMTAAEAIKSIIDGAKDIKKFSDGEIINELARRLNVRAEDVVNAINCI